MDNSATINKIKSLAESGECKGSSLEEIFARVYNAAKNTLGITPFDEQLAAALALADRKMVQMQTGEGKTLSAVFAACYESLNGGQVHILTFNDYLAHRDCEWMRPVYEEMGVTVGCITTDTPKEERAELYRKQVLYTTAKEAGFDYLRSFVLYNEPPYFPEELNLAIVDEADSILIDEARIPLVIAGDVKVKEGGGVAEVYEKVKALGEGDFEVDEESKNAYLTDDGADKCEEIFGKDVYAVGNEGLHAKICACLKARDILKEDKDYIISDGNVVLIDEFTGRAAPGRVFPGELQSAVEAKHGLKITSRGRIIGQIALQYYVRLYPKLAGMTGTAEQSREEFEKIYGILTRVIPTRLPSKRVDDPLELYFDRDEKQKAILAAIEEAVKNERPVLVGSESIAESEGLSAALAERGIKCSVLNAKNDFEEADIIARAGMLGAVTISTNMAGRGVDIKLGGENASDEEKKAVTDKGGLLVISTSMRESTRIVTQLHGRAGRQGDVGESRAFAALDDPVLANNDLKGLAGRHYPTNKIEGQLTDKTLLREAERAGRISENNALNEREQLMKYTLIGEKHRDLTFRRRNSLLDGSYNSEFWQKTELYDKALDIFGEEALQELQNRTLASLLNTFWSDYLDYTTYLREGIHLTQIAGRNPAEEYNIACEEYYEGAAAAIPERMEELLAEILESPDPKAYEPERPTRTYTYLLNDIGEEFKKKPVLVGFLSDSYEEAAEKTFEKAPETDGEPKKGFFKKLFKKQ